MTYRTVEIEITRHGHVFEPLKETVYGLFDDERLIIYSPIRHDLSPATQELNQRQARETPSP